MMYDEGLIKYNLVSQHYKVHCPKCGHIHDFGTNGTEAKDEAKQIMDEGGCSKCKWNETWTSKKENR